MSTPAASAEAGIPEYVLQRGDEVSIRVFGRPELDETVVVRPDGKISLPLLDDVEAAGLTATQLDTLLTSGYTTFFREPMLTVIVRSFANLRVYLGGEVASPGLVPLTGELSALAAVFLAGGFKSTARTDSVVLIRNSGDDTPVATVLDLKRVMEKGEPDVWLRPYDVLYVPMSRIAKLNKFMDQYVRKLLPISTVFGFQYVFGRGAVVAIPE